MLLILKENWKILFPIFHLQGYLTFSELEHLAFQCYNQIFTIRVDNSSKYLNHDT